MGQKQKTDLNLYSGECTIELTPAASSLVAKLQESHPTAHCLVLMRGVDVGNVIHLERTSTVVGRDENCDVTIDDEGISRKHALFNINGATCTVEDMGSTNGTFVNGRSIRSTVLQDGDKILLGRSTLLKYTQQDELELEFQRRIHQSASVDGLTGALNRKNFDERLEAEWSFALRQGTDLGILMMDVDFFKKINDTCGHAEGDKVLVAISRSVRDMIRTEDILARYGGEEFVVVARDLGISGARFLGERLRCCVEQLDIRPQGKPIPITISIGVACKNSSSAANARSLLLLADQRLYAAKRQGRNRIVFEGTF